jgi:hypothetical protein
MIVLDKEDVLALTDCLERFRLDFDDAYQYYKAYITIRPIVPYI